VAEATVAAIESFASSGITGLLKSASDHKVRHEIAGVGLTQFGHLSTGLALFHGRRMIPHGRKYLRHCDAAELRGQIDFAGSFTAKRMTTETTLAEKGLSVNVVAKAKTRLARPQFRQAP
jgi:hypothetical protein